MTRWAAVTAALVLALAPPLCRAAPAGVSGSVPSDVVRATLANGLRIVIVPDRLAPVVSTELNYLAGSNDAPEGFPGTAHALEHMMFRGSQGLDRDQLAQLGALLGGEYNADTTETVTQYTYTVPATELDAALHVEALRMGGLTLSPADWQQERGAIEQEVSRDLSSPIYSALSQMRAILFGATPYAHDALGTRPSFDKTEAPLLRNFYETWYAPNNAILVIAGDVDPQQALAQATAAFGAIPRRTVPPHAPFTVGAMHARTIDVPTDFPVGLVVLANRMPGLTDKDFAAADILGDVLGSERYALYGLVPAGRALAAQFDYQALPGVGLGLALAAFPKGGDPKPLLADLRQVLAGAAHDGVPEELVHAAQRQEIAQLAFANDSISGLAESWSQALAFQGVNSPDDLARAYAAVTVADVNRLAATLLDPDRMVTAILTPQSDGKPIVGRGFGGAESFNAAPDHPVALPAWAASAVAALKLPDPGAPPDASVLPNGLRLVVVPEHVSHTVSVFGRVREVAAMEEPPDQSGVASLTDTLFSYGAARHDRLGLRKAFDDIAAQEQAGAEFSLKVLAPQFDHGMHLLAENELQPAFLSPAFSPDIFGRVRLQLAQGLAGMLQSPAYLDQLATKRALVPPGDPELRQPSVASVHGLQLTDVQRYFDHAYRPEFTTLVVIGDVTPAAARQVVADTFGQWTSPGATPNIDLPAIGPNAASSTHVPDTTSLQSSVSLVQTVQMPIASPDRYTLMLGNDILGGGFSSRLYRDLRVTTGYVYSVGSELNWGKTRSDYTVSFGADPQNVDKARALIERDLHAMQTAPVSDTELTRAKAQVLRRLPMQRASVDQIAAVYLRLIDLGLPLDTETVAAQHFLAASAPQIQQAFATWLRPNALAQIVKGPALSN